MGSFDVRFECAKSFAADVMLDSFRVAVRGGCRHTEGDEEIRHNIVSLFGFGRHFHAPVCEKDGAIRLLGYEAAASQSRQCLCDGDGRHAELSRDFHGARLASRGNQFGNHLDIIFREFRLVRASRLPVVPCALGRMTSARCNPPPSFRSICHELTSSRTAARWQEGRHPRPIS